MQNVVSYSATVRWKSGTFWQWSARVPARDAVDADFPWYDAFNTREIRLCGDRVLVRHGDSPTLFRIPYQPQDWVGPEKVIPWNDPRVNAPNSVVSLTWRAQFDTFFVVQHHASGKFSQINDERNQPLRMGWGLDVELSFDNNRPVGGRSRVVRSIVEARPFNGRLPFRTAGPVAETILTQGHS
jgi:hypothetical protein